MSTSRSGAAPATQPGGRQRPPAATPRGAWRLLGVLLVLPMLACAHATTPTAPVGPSQRFRNEATQLTRIAYEDDFVEARLVLQALPLEAPERLVLREALIKYLLDPVARLDAAKLRREVRELDSDDIYDRVFDSFRDALGLFEPSDLWAKPVRMSAAEHDLLARTAKLVLAIYAPRGGDVQVIPALAVLATLEPSSPEWPARLDQVGRWTEELAVSVETSAFRRPTTAVDILDGTLSDWPAPLVAERLDRLQMERQKKFASVLRHPVGSLDSARKALGELLLAHGDDMQRAGVNVASIYLRCGLLDRAAQRTAELAEQAGDDPELRTLLAAAARPDATAADFLKLARRYLPRGEQLGGTAPDAPEPLVAFRVLQLGLARFPAEPELMILQAHLSRLLASPFLAIRLLEELEILLEKTPSAQPLLAKVSSELLELYFTRLRLRLDPERAAPAFDEADTLRKRYAETKRRFRDAELRVKDRDIDFELARSYVNAGLIERAEPLLRRVQTEDPAADVTIELANLALKRGDPGRATQILREGLETARTKGPPQDTIGSVHARSRLQKLLGDAFEMAGDRPNAEMAWRGAIIGFERLMIEHLRRKNPSASAEATFEVGRLFYVLGQRTEGIQKLEEALEQDPDREQSYIDAIAFLVQHGEVDPALGIYRRALARPDRSVSEYVKVYASLWLMDLTRRTTGTPDPTAQAFLKTLDRRHPEIRPHRAAGWYHQLARFAVGKVGYDQLLSAADTPGKRAEVYFYQAMRLLGEGQSDDAHQLWQKVIETKMFSFFEFDMASRYLRLGAPTAPAPEKAPSTETI